MYLLWEGKGNEQRAMSNKQRRMQNACPLTCPPKRSEGGNDFYKGGKNESRLKTAGHEKRGMTLRCLD